MVPSAQPTPLPTPTSPSADVSIPARIRARGYLLVGVRYDLSPFCYVTEEGGLAGFEVDLGRELAQRWLGDPEAVRFRQVRSDTAVEHLQARDVDLVLAALIHTERREEQVDFGPAYFLDGQALLVRAADVPTITAPADLGGRLVGVVSGAEAEETLAETVEFTPTIQPYTNFDQAVTALVGGDVDAVADLRRRLVRGLRSQPDTAIVGQYTSAAVAPAFVHGEPGLADLVALTLQEMFVDGAYDELYARWFPGDTLPAPEVWPGTSTLSLEEAEDTPSVSGTLEAVQTGGWLRVAMVDGQSPFAYLTEAGEPAGYEVHLVRMLADRWLGDGTAVNFLPVTFEEGLRMLVEGEADLLIGALPHTREMELQADFSLTTYVAGEGMMVRAGAPVGGIAGLDGQAVAAVADTGSADVLQQVSREAGVSVVVFPKASLDEAVAALEAGEVVAVVGDRADLLGPAYTTPGLGVTADRLTRVPLALALPPGDSAFRDLVNLTLRAMARDGLFPAVYGEWFDDDPPQMDPWAGEPVGPLRLGTPSP
jgi:ABC-type amino acid transport substrate-binding protein